MNHLSQLCMNGVHVSKRIKPTKEKRNLGRCNKHLKIPISTTLLKLLEDWDITYAIWFVSQRRRLTISFRCTKSHNWCGQQQCCDITILMQSDCVRIFWTSSCAELGPYNSPNILIARCDSYGWNCWEHRQKTMHSTMVLLVSYYSHTLRGKVNTSWKS